MDVKRNAAATSEPRSNSRHALRHELGAARKNYRCSGRAPGRSESKLLRGRVMIWSAMSVLTAAIFCASPGFFPFDASGGGVAMAQQNDAGALLTGGAVGGSVSTDATAGVAAAEISESGEDGPKSRNLWQVLRNGGLLMLPIGCCSLVLMTIVMERFVALRRSRILPKAFVQRFLEQVQSGDLDRNAALEVCEENDCPIAQVFAGAIRKWGRPSVEVEQGIIDAGERVTNHLRRNLRVINGIANIAPLLGLLGTVVGMIDSFDAIATSSAMGRPELLVSGISQALLTTAAGLSVAIPAMIAYMFFVGRVDRLVIDMDRYGQELVNTISDEELSAVKERSRKSRAA
mgnify:CR=1 FL=1